MCVQLIPLQATTSYALTSSRWLHVCDISFSRSKTGPDSDTRVESVSVVHALLGFRFSSLHSLQRSGRTFVCVGEGTK